MCMPSILADAMEVDWYTSDADIRVEEEWPTLEVELSDLALEMMPCVYYQDGNIYTIKHFFWKPIDNHKHSYKKCNSYCSLHKLMLTMSYVELEDKVEVCIGNERVDTEHLNEVYVPEGHTLLSYVQEHNALWTCPRNFKESYPIQLDPENMIIEEMVPRKWTVRVQLPVRIEACAERTCWSESKMRASCSHGSLLSRPSHFHPRKAFRDDEMMWRVIQR